MHVPDILRILRTRWPIILFATAFTLVAAGALLPSKLPERDDQRGARATSTLVLSEGDKPRSASAAGTQLNTLKVIASGGEVPAQVAAALNTTVPDLLSRVTISSQPATSSLTIVALDRTRAGAERTADTYSKKLLELLTAQAQTARDASRQALTEQIEKLQADKAVLDESAKTDPASKPGADAVARQLSAQQVKLNQLNAGPPVTPPLRSIGPPTVRAVASARGADRFLRLPVRLALGGLLGFGGSLAALALIDRFDVRLRTKKAAELAYGVPVLAEVPALPRVRSGGLLVTSQPHGPYAESHRILRTAILRSNPAAADRPPQAPAGSCLIVVTSADPGEGKTSTAANLAASFAEAGRDTLLVGLDLRHDDLQSLVPSGPRAEEVRLPAGRHGSGVIRVSVSATGVRDLRLVTVSPRPVDPPAIVLPVVAAWLEGLKDQVDAIVVDTPPLLVCNDASEIIPFADTVLLTCRAGVTTIEATERATEVLARLGAPVCGVVLVGATLRAAARKVSAYGATGGAPTDDGTDDPGTDDPGRGLTSAEAVIPASWRTEAPADAPADREEPADPVPVPVRAEERESKAVPEAHWRPVPLPAAGASTIARRTLDLARDRIGRRTRRR